MMDRLYGWQLTDVANYLGIDNIRRIDMQHALERIYDIFIVAIDYDGVCRDIFAGRLRFVPNEKHNAGYLCYKEGDTEISTSIGSEVKE